MNCQVYLKDGMLCIHNQFSMVFTEMQYPLGDGATDFSMFPESNMKLMVGRFRDDFIENMEKQESEEKLLEQLRAYVAGTSQINPYFNFYMDVFVVFLLALRKQRSDIPKMLKSFLFGGEQYEIDDIDFTDIYESSMLVAKMFVYDARVRKTRLKEDYEAITGDAEDYKNLTPMQRLYLLSKQDRNYLSGEFKTTLKPDYPIPPKENDLTKIKSTLLENKVDIVEMVEIYNLDDLLSFELYHTLKSDLIIRKCKHCDEFFIVRGRIDIEYCDRVKEGETKPCCIIGATRSYWGSKVDDPIHTAFQKAYKRNHSRQRVGKMTQTEFYEWSEEARQKRSECESGKLSLADFMVWLGNKK